MTPVPYVLNATGDEDGLFTAELSYGGTVIAAADGLKEAKLEKWARTAASEHKARISPSESFTKQTVIKQSLVL